MTLLPIIQRELLSRSRNQATYWARSAVALVGVLVCLQSLTIAFAAPTMMGRYVFNGVLTAAFIVSCFVVFLTADAICAERREGTLELLFVTRVRPLDVLLGKLSSTGLTSLCALAGFLPILMVPVLAGGVTGGEAFRKSLALLNTTFLALVAGLCASAAQRERFRAVRKGLALLGLVLISPFLAYVVTAGGPVHQLGVLSPLVTLSAANDLAYAASPGF